jgi:hypothetical protein
MAAEYGDETLEDKALADDPTAASGSSDAP